MDDHSFLPFSEVAGSKCERSLRIVIATTGRFHVGALARELADLGHHVTFYSYSPKRLNAGGKLTSRDCRSLLVYVAPLLFWRRIFPNIQKQRINRWIIDIVDQVMTWRLPQCDVFIGMAGVYLKTARHARERYGAKIIVERGSRHIRSQREILRGLSLDGVEAVPETSVARDIMSYDFADVISVPSMHVWQSFLDEGVASDRLFRNPYGVSLDQFRPTSAPATEPRTVLLVGMWCRRKGCPELAEAVRRLQPGIRLLHVGPVSDAPLPTEDWFEHHDAVQQSSLSQFYGQAHVFALPSYEEGLALVLPQALRSGLPIVCSDRSGGEDIRDLLGLGNEVAIVPHGDIDALANALINQLETALQRFDPGDLRNLTGNRIDNLTWRSYGARYDAFLSRLVFHENGKNKE